MAGSEVGARSGRGGWGHEPIAPDVGLPVAPESEAGPQVSFEILIDGNLDEKSLFLAAMDTATWRATAR